MVVALTSTQVGDDHGRRRAGRRARHRDQRAAPCTARSRANHVDAHRASSPTTSPPGPRRTPDFVVWPENSTAVDPFLDDRGQRRDRRGLRRDRRADPGRRHGRRPARRHAGAQPGHRLPPGTRRRGPLHQAAPGALRRVHPVPRHAPAVDDYGQLTDDPARHGPRHQPGAAPGRTTCWWPTRSASTWPTTTGSTARWRAAPSWSPCRPATRCSADTAPDRPAVRDHPAAGPRDRPLGRGGRDQRHLRRRRPDGSVVASARPATQDVLVEDVGLGTTLHPRRPDRGRGPDDRAWRSLVLALGARRSSPYRRRRRRDSDRPPGSTEPDAGSSA